MIALKTIRESLEILLWMGRELEAVGVPAKIHGLVLQSPRDL